ncbi:MAG: META domain-containing protein [Bacteroidota bacterium]
MNKIFFPALLVYFCLAGCQSEIPAPGGDLSSLYHTWTLLGIEQGNEYEAVPAELDPLNMELKAQSQASLNSSCNQGGGDYKADSSGSIDFETSVWTEAYCGQLGDQWERLYINSLASVEHFSIAGDQLWLWNDEVSLRFQR